MLFHYNSGNTNPPHCHVTRTVHV